MDHRRDSTPRSGQRSTTAAAESAGTHRSGTTRTGDPWLRSALARAAWSAARTEHTSLQARYWRISRRRGDEKAIIAVAHHLLVVIWWMLHGHVTYSELDRRRR